MKLEDIEKLLDEVEQEVVNLQNLNTLTSKMESLSKAIVELQNVSGQVLKKADAQTNAIDTAHKTQKLNYEQAISELKSHNRNVTQSRKDLVDNLELQKGNIAKMGAELRELFKTELESEKENLELAQRKISQNFDLYRKEVENSTNEIKRDLRNEIAGIKTLIFVTMIVSILALLGLVLK